MSLRRIHHSAPVKERSAPGTKDLSRVLAVGIANKVAAEVELTDVEFEVEVKRVASKEAEDLPTVLRKKYFDMVTMTTDAYMGRASDFAKRGGSTLVKKSKQGAMNLAKETKRIVKGEYSSMDYKDAPASLLASRLKAKYKTVFVEDKLKYVKAESNPYLAFVSDSGTNLFASIEITKFSVLVQVWVQELDEATGPASKRSVEKFKQSADYPFGKLLQRETYKTVCTKIDMMIDQLVDDVKELSEGKALDEVENMANMLKM